MRKYSSHESAHLASEMKNHVKLFRAQRNFYLTGFAIFLSFVIRRLISMLIIQHELELKADEIIKKAEDTVKMAKTTVLANTFQNSEDIEIRNKLDLAEKLVQEQKLRINELEQEASMWRVKYEEIKCNLNAKGDD
ncbi:unnamed protein product [Leptidea sinapis]|uniref:BAP29/BAP31 transmembrane domain-containing protein n=1 Tax=Leptidea sinapis TaxID=189913 RepID=A0A5E4Q2X4_9NEOP|nr:unnamed protein product [Leptidea sinapis]